MGKNKKKLKKIAYVYIVGGGCRDIVVVNWAMQRVPNPFQTKINFLPTLTILTEYEPLEWAVWSSQWVVTGVRW